MTSFNEGALNKRSIGHNTHQRDQFKPINTFAQSYEICHNIDKEKKQEAHGPHRSPEN